MKVKELIDELQKRNPEAEAKISMRTNGNEGHSYSIEKIDTSYWLRMNTWVNYSKNEDFVNLCFNYGM